MLQHLKYSLPDWILCVLASMGLSINVVQSFLLPESMSRNVFLVAVVCAVVIAVLVVCSYSRVTTIVSLIVFGVGIILALLFAFLGVIPGLSESSDPEENTALWYVVVILCSLVVYLLARTRITSWLLLVVGVLATAYFAVLEYTVYVWGLLLFLFAVGAWICFVGYRKNIMQVSAMRTAFAPMACWAAGVSLICLLVGSVLWWGVIRPVDPPTEDLTVLTDYLELERLEQLGLIDEDQIYDSTTLSNWINRNYIRYTNELEENQDIEDDLDVEGTQQEEENEEESEEETPVTQQEGIVDWIEHNLSSGMQVVLLIILIILAVLILAALVILFIFRRKIWYRHKTKKMTDEEYIRYFYPWYLVRLWRLRLPKPRGDSPMEYARRLEVPARFLDDTGVTWEEVSEAYAHLMYSGRKARPGDREKMDTFFNGFFRACRKKKRLAWVWYALRV